MTTTIADASNQKLRGGYYTPPSIAHFLSQWAIRHPSDAVLEPSCGDGAILGAAARRLLHLGATPSDVSHQLTGVELFASEATAAQVRLQHLGVPLNGSVLTGDFFSALGNPTLLPFEVAAPLANKRFDVVLGNPPFLRFQTFPEAQREQAFALMRKAGLNPNRLTNAWVPFLVASALQLRPGGRLAMVIPAELLQVKYAEETRLFLAHFFDSITLISFKKLVFEGIQQEVVLVLAEREAQGPGGIDLIEIEDEADLAAAQPLLEESSHYKTIDHAADKWLVYLLEQREIDLIRTLRAHPSLKRLGNFASVDVGVVTGKNEFFVVDAETVQARDLAAFAVPLAGRTVQLPGLRYARAEWQAQADAGYRCFLLDFSLAAVTPLSENARAFIREGEQRGMHTGYKCRIRDPWYKVPNAWQPDAFLFRQIHRYPKLVLNEAGATATDTIHRVRFKGQAPRAALIAAFHSSLTFAFFEVMGRSYGGGVLEIEPNEAENVPLPLAAECPFDLDTLDEMERRNRMDLVLDETDRVLLRDHLGLDAGEVRALRAIGAKLSERRVNRKARKRTP